MRLIQQEDQGAICLNFMWLPTFMGMNVQFKRDVERVVMEKYRNTPLTQDVLDSIHNCIVDYACSRFPVPGLRDYLDGIKFVESQD